MPGLLLCLAVSPLFAAPAAEPITFEKQIRPLLKAHCFGCHGEGTELKGGLDLRLRRLALKGGDSGPALVVGKPGQSRLHERVRLGEMPPDGPRLTKEQVELIGVWIAAGAPTARPEPAQVPASLVTEEDRQHWAFRPVRRPEVPTPKAADLVRTPIDAFLLARLEAKGLSYWPEADKRTLLLRASFDLTGLPPSQDEIDAFLSDDSPDAYDRLIDRLLASPHYGERWGRHWLDAAGYADSDGYTDADAPRGYAYKYRDYVIRAHNADKPYDEFLREQLAGDELASADPKDLSPSRLEKLIATGYLRMAADGTGTAANELEIARNQVVADAVKIVTTSLLGLSVGCAQCHDHRYDPIPQVDYYRIRAVFEPAYDWKNWRTPNQRLVSLYTDADRAKVQALAAEAAEVEKQRTQKRDVYLAEAFEKELLKHPEAERSALRAAFQAPAAQRTPEQKKLVETHPNLNLNEGVLYQYNQAAADDLKKISDQIAAIRAKAPPEDFIAPLTDPAGPPPVTYRFHRGDHRQPKEAVPPGDLTVASLDGEPVVFLSKDPRSPGAGRRLAFARRLTDGKHPLTTRVLVNRVWMHHFGRGIVGTPHDFGAMGETPSHPELLDWLADDFATQGWRLKRLHKLIMTSTAYKQTSQRPKGAEAAERDPRDLWGQPVRRLDAESLRDRMLAVAGRLSPKMFGPPATVQEDSVGQIIVDPNETRRSVYLQIRRSKPISFLRSFDAPVMETNCDRRVASTVAPQALMLLNNDFVLQSAAQMASRVLRDEPVDSARQVDRAFRLAFLRSPDSQEAKDAAEFLKIQSSHWESEKAKSPKNARDPKLESLANFCHVLLCSNEFLYVD